MAAHQQRTASTSRRPVFRRYALLESVEKTLYDLDSNYEDMLGLDNLDSDEEETESNQNHPLLSDLLHDASDRDLEPRTGSLRNTDGALAETAPSAAVPCTGRQPAQVIRGRGGGGRGVTRANTRRRGRGPGSLFLR